MNAVISLALLTGLAARSVSAATAAEPVEIVIVDAGRREADGSVVVDLRLLNDGANPATIHLTDRVAARLSDRVTEHSVWLERDAATPANTTVPGGGFARARYRLRGAITSSLDGSTLSVPALTVQQVVLADRTPPLPSAGETAPESMPAERDIPRPLAASAPADRSAGNPFLRNLGAYQPIYAVYGPGTNSEARLQISFKYRLLGVTSASSPGDAQEGLHFGYTQRMFWDLGAESSPFRNIDFQPELFYLTPSATLANGTSLSLQAGIAHESNGRDGEASRSLNAIYVAPAAAIPLGGAYRLVVAPRLSAFVGDLSDNPDIRRYRGNTGLSVEIGEDDGLRLSTSTRFNFGSGKGALSADLSYPLPRIYEGLPAVYLFGQSFIGYGENLLDYNRRMTRFRIGVALVR
ncbi:phospholipase A [Sphingobium sp. DC-2]|uniref:phospholipase A n=1 Tax=Sphingobium sp. DC-2 TaxID=1303256 RepID=UPI0004C433D4|nr:phospholipase A [Sphingobium sp. DC-2]